MVTREYRNPYTVILDCKDAQALITHDNQSGMWEGFVLGNGNMQFLEGMTLCEVETDFKEFVLTHFS